MQTLCQEYADPRKDDLILLSLGPRKLAALFEYLPDEVGNNVNARVYAGKDTYAAGRLVQKWRKPTNPISKGKLLTKDLGVIDKRFVKL